MALINRPIYEHFGARHLGVKGPGALTNLEEGVMGTLPLDLSSDPSYWYIQGFRPFGGYKVVSAAAASYGMVGLSVESSNAEFFCRILGAHIIESTSGDVNIKRCARGDFSTDPGVIGYSLDTRVPQTQESQATILNNADSAQPGVSLGRVARETMAQPWIFDMPLIVSPGQVIYFADVNQNTDFGISITWVEVPAYKAEL